LVIELFELFYFDDSAAIFIDFREKLGQPLPLLLVDHLADEEALDEGDEVVLCLRLISLTS
jgi:hypothetical protein